MVGKLLVIEVGYSLTKAVVMDAKGSKPKVYQCFQFETPVDMFEDGTVKPSETFRGLLNAECSKRNVTTKNVIFTIASNAIASRVVMIPFVKEKKIAEILSAGMDDYFPVDISMYKTSWKILEVISGEDKQKKYRINVTIVPNELVSSYKALAKMCGLNLIALDYIGNSICQVARGVFPKGCTAILKIDEQTSMLTVLKDGKFDMQRNLAYGIDDALAAIMNDPSAEATRSYNDSLNIVRHKTCIRQHLNPTEHNVDDDAEEYFKVRDSATEGLRPLVTNISRALAYYESQNKETVLEHIAVVGQGANFSGLTKLLTNELGQKVTAMLSLDSMKDTGAFLDEGTSMSAYAACIGAGMSPLNILGNDIVVTGKAEGGKTAGGKELSLVPALIVCGVGIAAAAAMLVYGMISSTMIQTENLDLQTKITQLQSAQSAYNEYTATEARVQNYQKMYAYTENQNNQLKAFIDELEKKMPSDINIVSFSADDTGIAMTVNVTSKESAALVLQQLRSFTSITDVTTGGITEDTAEGAAPTVNMSVTCSYPVTDSSADSGTQSGQTTESVQSTSSGS